MKDLTEEEFKGMPLRGRGNSSQVYRNILNMQVGKISMVEKHEWKNKYPPTRLARQIEKRYGYKYETTTHAGGLGWVFRRVG